MKALWIEAPGVVRFGDIPEPATPSGWVKIKVLAAAVCGSDLKVYRSGRSYKVDRRVSGHEFVGQIEEVTNADSPWKVGHRVCVYPQLFCGECSECRKGHINMCPNKKNIGGRDYDGGFAEHVVVPESLLYAVPDNISDIEAAMVEPFAVGLHAVNLAGGAALRDKSVLIYGAGPLAFFVLESLKYYGARQIILCGRVPKRLELALEHGATDVIYGKDTPEALRAKVMELTGGEGVDAVIDTACLGATIENDMYFCKPKGVISVPGMTQTRFEVDFLQMQRRELTIVGSYTYTTEMRDCLQILGEGKLSTRYIADPVVPLSEGVETFRKLTDSPNDCLKGVFIP